MSILGLRPCSLPLALLLALSVLVACAPPRAPAQPDSPTAAIDSDMEVTRPAKPPVPGSLADESALMVPAPAPAAAASAASPERPMPGGEGTGLGAVTGAGDPRIGRSFALDNCRPCHVVARDQSSPIRFANAPNFRDIAKRPQTTRFGLSVWLTNPHPTMPTLQLSPEEASNVIAYIMSLKN